MATRSTGKKKKAAKGRAGARAAKKRTGRWIGGDPRPPSKGGARIPHHSIRAARENISQLVDAVGDSASAAVSLGRRENRSAVILSFERVEPLLSQDYASRLAFVIVENLLQDAPLHIRSPQVEELRALPKADLLLLAGIEQLPLSEQAHQDLEARLANPEALRRLVKRFELTQAISRAREQGLYEVAEHRTSAAALGEDEDG